MLGLHDSHQDYRDDALQAHEHVRQMFKEDVSLPHLQDNPHIVAARYSSRFIRGLRRLSNQTEEYTMQTVHALFCLHRMLITGSYVPCLLH